jgi:hypothetical protein
MIRRFVAWLFGRVPDPGPLFPMHERGMEPASGPRPANDSLAARQESEDRMLREIDAKLDEARRHLERTEQREKER